MAIKMSTRVKNLVLTCNSHICLNFLFVSGDVFYVKDHLALKSIMADGENLAKILSSLDRHCDSGENPRLLHYLYPDKPFPTHRGKLYSVLCFPEFHFTVCPLFLCDYNMLVITFYCLTSC